MLFRQFDIQRFMLFVFQQLGNQEAGELVFFVDMGFFAPFLYCFKVFVGYHFCEYNIYSRS